MTLLRGSSLTNTVVGQLIRRSSWSRWGWGAALLVLAGGLLVSYERYLENDVRGPFPIDNADLASITSASSPRHYYLVVRPDRAMRTGYERTRNARTEANYLIFEVAKRLLFSDVAVEHEGGTFTGFLEVVPVDERNGVLEEILGRHPEMRGRMLPFKLNSWYGFKTNAYILLALIAGLVLGGFWLLLRGTLALTFPERHPIARKLSRHGEPDRVASAIDAELEAGQVLDVDGTRVSSSWLVPKFGSLLTRPNGDFPPAGSDAVAPEANLQWR